MQVNTKIQNPTNYFFNEATKETEDYSSQIAEFTKKLINCDTCVLCKQRFNLTTHVPRILIHCGHTFCTECLRNFHKKKRVRCPMCLKLVKQIDTIDRLPINHTIFTKLADAHNKSVSLSSGQEFINSQAYLYQAFEQSQKKSDQQQQQQQNPVDYNPHAGGQLAPLIDEETGLELCQFHQDRIKHFLCINHKMTCCRACNDQFHVPGVCQIIELYDIDDMLGFLDDFFKKNGMYAENGIVAAAAPGVAVAAAHSHQQQHVDFPNFKPDQTQVVPNYQFKDGEDEDEEEVEFEDDDEGEFDDDDEEEDQN